jgi:hypothetical protein
MTIHQPNRSRFALLCATALLIGGISTTAEASSGNNASAGNDRTMDTQYSRTLLPLGGTKGESNRWDESYWTGVTTRTAENPRPYGHEDHERYAHNGQYHNGQYRDHQDRPYAANGNLDNDYSMNDYYYQRGMYYSNGTPYHGDWKSGW